MELDTILTILAFVAPFAGGAGIVIKKGIFLARAAQQTVEVFEKQKERNVDIYNKIQADPEKKELAQILDGGVRKIKGLTNLS